MNFNIDSIGYRIVILDISKYRNFDVWYEYRIIFAFRPLTSPCFNADFKRKIRCIEYRNRIDYDRSFCCWSVGIVSNLIVVRCQQYNSLWWQEQQQQPFVHTPLLWPRTGVVRTYCWLMCSSSWVLVFGEFRGGKCRKYENMHTSNISWSTSDHLYIYSSSHAFRCGSSRKIFVRTAVVCMYRSYLPGTRYIINSRNY